MRSQKTHDGEYERILLCSEAPFDLHRSSCAGRSVQGASFIMPQKWRNHFRLNALVGDAAATRVLARCGKRAQDAGGRGKGVERGTLAGIFQGQGTAS